MNEPSPFALPKMRDLYYGGSWHRPRAGAYFETFDPATQESLGCAADADADDVAAAVAAAKEAFETWRDVMPGERARLVREMANIVRANARELAWIDAADCGNPFTEMVSDAMIAGAVLDLFAGLATEIKGASVPLGPDAVNFSVREPWGVVGRIIPFNHPFMFAASKAAAPLVAGNTVVIKAPEQSPLSALRLAELLDGLFPPGVLNFITGGRASGAALVRHPDIRFITLTGSVPTGRAVMAEAAARLTPVLLELGGKNALIAFPDADPAAVADAMVRGMNFTWCGQSCGSTSRAFLHDDIHDAVMSHLPAMLARHRPGIPRDPATTMGAIVSKAQFERIEAIIAQARAEGATLFHGGKRPDNPELANGWFLEPTVFVDVEPHHRIANEEIFGPVLSVFSWQDEKEMMKRVNDVEYGLTCSIWTNDLHRAHRTAARVEAGYVWVNEVSRHFLGTPFGGTKQSGIGREESIGELMTFTQEKSIHINLAGRKAPW